MKTAKKPVQLTSSLLRSLIEEEVKGFGDMEDVEDRKKDTEELDADEQADGVEKPVDWKKANHIKESDTLEGHIDYMKALKLEESRMAKIAAQGQKAAARLAQIREALKKGADKLVIAKVV